MISIFRDRFYDNKTLGKLFFDGEFVCFTLEDTARADGVKIVNATAIPEGVYLCKLNYSKRFKKTMPLIYNRRGDLTIECKGVRFSGIRLHGGNTEEDTNGCILVGKKRNEGKIFESFSDELIQLIQKKYGAKEFVLTIQNVLYIT